MKRIGLLLSLLFVFSTTTWSQFRTKKVIPNSRMETRTAAVSSPFHTLECGGGFTIEYQEGPSVSVTVEGPDNMLDLVNVSCSDEVLQIGLLQGYRIIGNTKTTVRITAPAFSKIAFNGSGNLQIQQLSTDSMTVKVLGSGRITGEKMDCSVLKAEVTGSGSVVLNGNIGTSELYVSGSGHLEVNGLSGKEVTARVTGSGNIRLSGRVSQLQKEVTGSGDIDISQLEIPASAL